MTGDAWLPAGEVISQRSPKRLDPYIPFSVPPINATSHAKLDVIIPEFGFFLDGGEWVSQEWFHAPFNVLSAADPVANDKMDFTV